MKAKHFLTCATVAVAAGSAFAFEATEFVDPPSTLTRAAVVADLARARLADALPSRGEATVFVDGPAVPARTWADAQAEWRVAGERRVFDDQYAGSV